MLRYFKVVDALLRGDATRRATADGSIDIPVRGLIGVIAILGIFYGACMGTFSLVTGRGGGWLQMLAAMGKVPALFLLTLAVTFPSLYVFNALVGSRLTLVGVLRLVIGAISIMLAMLASFGTIVAFFSFTTESYPFVIVLNVVVFAISGALGLAFLMQTLHRMTIGQQANERRQDETQRAAAAESLANPVTPHDDVPPAPRGPLSRIDARPTRNVRLVFQIWLVVFGLVGSQMSWVLRPFIGSGQTFALFRPRGSNFFEAVTHHIRHLFS